LLIPSELSSQVSQYCTYVTELMYWQNPIANSHAHPCSELHEPGVRECDINQIGAEYVSEAIYKYAAGVYPCIREESLPRFKYYLLCDCDQDGIDELEYWYTEDDIYCVECS